MATPTPDQLGIFYTSKDLATSETDLPNRIVGSGSTVFTINVPALTQANDYWNGAVGVFVGTSTTAALRGFFFHVRRWDSATKTLTLAQPLPAIPSAGDTFKLIASGQTASNVEVYTMKVGGKQPEIETVTGTQVTGVTIKKASALLGEGTLTLSYIVSPARAISIRMGSGNNGPEVALTANATNLPVYNSDLSGFLLVDVTYSSLSTAARTDTFTISAPKGNFIPCFEGYETNDGVGRTRYHLVVAKNKSVSPLDAMTAFSIWTGKPVGTQANMSGAHSFSTDTPGSFNVGSAANWPTRGFWVRNRTCNAGAGDLRYIDYRSGNTCYVKPVTWGYLQFRNGTVELRNGTAITGGTSNANAIVDQVVLTGGSWSAGTATGTLTLKKFTGTFSNSEQIRIDGNQVALAAAVSTRGFRGFTAVTWANNDRVEPASDIDIGINLPSGGFYRSPENVNIMPEGVTCGHYSAQDEALILESVMPGNSGDYEDCEFGLWFAEMPPVVTLREPDQRITYTTFDVDYSVRITQAYPLWCVVMAVKGNMRGPASEIYLEWSNALPRRSDDQMAFDVFIDEKLHQLKYTSRQVEDVDWDTAKGYW